MGYHYRTDILANFAYEFDFGVFADMNCTNMSYNSN